MRWLVLLSLLLSPTVNALELESLYLRFNKFLAAEHPLFWRPHRMRERLALDINLKLFGPLFFYNTLHVSGSDTQVHLVGWHGTVGWRVTDRVAITYEHHSQHVADRAWPGGHFPVEDSLGVVVKIY